MKFLKMNYDFETGARRLDRSKFLDDKGGEAIDVASLDISPDRLGLDQGRNTRLTHQDQLTGNISFL